MADLKGLLGTPNTLKGSLSGSLIPGPKGDKGDKGERGPQGEKGEKGDKGDKGDTGDTGPQGPRGETGERGPTGETGAQGPQGEIGPAGPKGDTGEQGPKGDMGPAGPTGPKGDKGDPGEISFEQFCKVFPTDTVSGAVASFPDGADDIPLKSCIVQIEPVQAGSGDPSPDNVRPISGWTGCEVQRTGKNLLGGYDFANNIKQNLPNAVIDASVGTVSFGYSTSTASAPVLDGVPFKENTRYTFVLSVLNAIVARTNLNIYYTDGTSAIIGMTKTNEKETIVVSSAANKTVKCLGLQRQGGTTALYYDECGVFEGVLTAGDFVPYTEQTYPITFPTEAGTVYGGYIDPINGELVVDRAQIASYNGETLPSTWISDRDVYASGTTPTIGAQVVYELAESIHYPLTATEIKTLLGQNNIWSNTGDTTVEYAADIQRYITKKSSEIMTN